MRRRGLAALAATAAIAGCGDDGESGGGPGKNAKMFSGEQRAVAQVVDEMVAAARSGDSARICTKVMTSALADAVAKRNDSSCEQAVQKQLLDDDSSIEVKAVNVDKALAEASVEERNGNVSRLAFLKQDGRWRLNGID